MMLAVLIVSNRRTVYSFGVGVNLADFKEAVLKKAEGGKEC